MLTEESRAANFTNERGVDGMGMWLLEECRRTWARKGRSLDLDTLLRDPAAARPFAALIESDDPVFLAPGDMPSRIDVVLARTGQPRADGRAVCAVRAGALGAGPSPDVARGRGAGRP